MKLNQLKSLLKHIMVEAIEAGVQPVAKNNVPERDYNDPRIIAHSIYQPVYLTTYSHKEKDGSDIFEVLLYSATGPRHFIKRDTKGNWFYLRDHDRKWVSADAYIKPPKSGEKVPEQPERPKGAARHLELGPLQEMIANKDVAPEPIGAVNVEEGPDGKIDIGVVKQYITHAVRQYPKDKRKAAGWLLKIVGPGNQYSAEAKLASDTILKDQSGHEIPIQSETILKEDLNYQGLLKARELSAKYFGKDKVKDVRLKQYDQKRDTSLYKVTLDNDELKYFIRDRENRWYEKVPSETMGHTDQLLPIDISKLDAGINPNSPEKQSQKMPSIHVAKSWNPDAMLGLKMAKAEEQSVSGGAGAYSTPFAFKKKKIRESGSFEAKVRARIEGVISKAKTLKNEKILPDGRYADDMWDGGRMKRATGMDEETSSGAVFSGGPTIQTPAWGTKNKLGSPKAIKASKSLGMKVVKSITDEE